MTELRWKGRDIITFLKLIEKYPCLWDLSSDDYLNKRMKDDAYMELLVETKNAGFSIDTADTLRKKIKSLRDTFKKELGRVHKTQAMGVEVHRPRLMWFKEGKELWDAPPPPNLQDKLSPPKKPKLMDLELETQRVPESDQDSESSSASEYIEITEPKCAIKMSTSESLRNRRRHSPVTSSRDKRLKRRHQPYGSESSVDRQINMNAVDQYEQFAKHLASQMRELPMKSFILLQNKFQNIITEERLANLKEK